MPLSWVALRASSSFFLLSCHCVNWRMLVLWARPPRLRKVKCNLGLSNWSHSYVIHLLVTSVEMCNSTWLRLMNEKISIEKSTPESYILSILFLEILFLELLFSRNFLLFRILRLMFNVLRCISRFSTSLWRRLLRLFLLCERCGAFGWLPLWTSIWGCIVQRYEICNHCTGTFPEGLEVTKRFVFRDTATTGPPRYLALIGHIVRGNIFLLAEDDFWRRASLGCQFFLFSFLLAFTTCASLLRISWSLRCKHVRFLFTVHSWMKLLPAHEV